MKLVAIFSDTIQTGPDDFAPTTRVLAVTPETTVAELMEWRYRYFKGPFSGPVTIVAADEPCAMDQQGEKR
jgi:hypothetical protein